MGLFFKFASPVQVSLYQWLIANLHQDKQKARLFSEQITNLDQSLQSVTEYEFVGLVMEVMCQCRLSDRIGFIKRVLQRFPSNSSHIKRLKERMLLSFTHSELGRLNRDGDDMGAIRTILASLSINPRLLFRRSIMLSMIRSLIRLITKDGLRRELCVAAKGWLASF